MFVEYTGMSSQAYGCGACAADAKGKTCSECTAEDNKAACNVAVKEGLFLLIIRRTLVALFTISPLDEKYGRVALFNFVVSYGLFKFY